MKPTQSSLAEYIGMSTTGLSKMKREHPKKFELIWIGWVNKCKDSSAK